MSQHDFDIANQTASNARADLNNALKALATLSSGSSAPSTTYANMLWYDTGNNILKMRTEADDAWIDVGYLCQSTNKFCIFDDTNVVNSSGTQVGLIGDQPTSDWEAGTSTTESLVSPAKVKAAIDENVPPPSGIGVGQTWQPKDIPSERAQNTNYQNNSGNPIGVFLRLARFLGRSIRVQVSSDGSSWIDLLKQNSSDDYDQENQTITFIVPNGHYYRVADNTTFDNSVVDWAELR